MRQEVDKIDEGHRKELLRFLLVKTAAVRRGVKPGELLRVRHCYAGVNAEGLRVCLYRSDIYGILGLDYVELKVEAESSLVLFYDPATLAATLSERRNARWLARMGYPEIGNSEKVIVNSERMNSERGMAIDRQGLGSGGLDLMLAHLVRRAAECELPHEVGVFIGYPLKDVAGFIRNIPATPVHKGAWRVYGDAEESLARMRAYADIEEEARAALDKVSGIGEFIEMISFNKAS